MIDNVEFYNTQFFRSEIMTLMNIREFISEYFKMSRYVALGTMDGILAVMGVTLAASGVAGASWAGNFQFRCWLNWTFWRYSSGHVQCIWIIYW